MKNQINEKEKKEMNHIISSMLLGPISKELAFTEYKNIPLFIDEARVMFLFSLLNSENRRDMTEYVYQEYNLLKCPKKEIKNKLKSLDNTKLNTFFVSCIKNKKEQFLKETETITTLLLMEQFRFYQFSESSFKDIVNHKNINIGRINLFLKNYYSVNVQFKLLMRD